MMLYVNGQDIGTFVLGLVGETVLLQTYTIGPEGYLATIESFLGEQGQTLEQVDAVILVTGPGSPTALRATHAIVNTIHFTTRIPIMVLQKESSMPDGDVVTREAMSRLAPLPVGAFAEPIYARGPRITASKKDALGRIIPHV